MMLYKTLHRKLWIELKTLQASTLYIPVPHSWHSSFTVCTSCTWCLSQSVHVCFCWTTITWGVFASHVLHSCEHWQLGQPLLSLLPNTYPCSHVAIVKEECHECGTGIYNVDACNVLWEKKGKVKTLGLEQWFVMPLSKIFQSYRGGHFYIFILEHGM
jgi:hypothetical protein